MKKNHSVDTKLTEVPIDRQHFIVAIGASAGGLEAIHDFFDNVTESSNLSFVIIQHLSPDYKSLLVELVAKHTYMKVQEAEDGVLLERGCIYVIPPKKMMTISDCRLQLTDKKNIDKGPNTAIDIFLHSLAKDKGDKSIAVILSGTGTDGTKGIEVISKAGGMVVVQEPESAKFDGMPKSAIATGCADMILAPWQMPEEIANYIDDTSNGVFTEKTMDEKVLEDILKLIYKNTGCDFHNYKYPTILRRIARRIKKLELRHVKAYLSYLKKQPGESQVLCKDFLIGVTKFFRDKEAFDSLQEQVISKLIHDKSAGETIKVWVTACSSGEEAYSIAILLYDMIAQSKKNLSIKIFATDTDANAIDYASRGIYETTIEKDIPASYLDSYFIKRDATYQIIPEIRKLIVFAKHNIITDPPFIKNDLVTCRNMLIYMNSALQKKVLSTLHFAMNPGGYLFLGSTESVSMIRETLEDVDRKWKIFRRIETVNRPYHELFSKPLTSTRSYTPRTVPDFSQAKTQSGDFSEDIKQILCDDLGYVAIYIDSNLEVRHTAGDYKKFLSLPDKQINLNLLKLLSKSLVIPVHKMIRQAWNNNEKVNEEKVTYRSSEGIKQVSVLVRPMPASSLKTGYTLILLKELPVTAQPVEETPVKVGELNDPDFLNGLHEELNETKLSLQTTIEELETTNEELQSANEEMISSNEELQSSNEELQSLNEELHTLNTEHQLKINELIQLNDDLNNYFRSTDIGQIFLDKDLRIRKFNPSVGKLVNLIESDIGRPITDISTNLLNINIDNALQEVISTKMVVEKEIFTRSGQSYLMKLYPYINNNNKSDGIILTFVDISLIKNLNEIINGVFESSQSSIFAFETVTDGDHKVRDFTCVAANRASESFWKKPINAIINHSLESIFPIDVKTTLFKEFRKVYTQGIPSHFEISFEQKSFEGVAVRTKNGIAATFTNVTDKKTDEAKLRKNFNELIRTKEDLKVLNSNLEEKIQERTQELSKSEERFRLLSQATNDAIIDWRLIDNDIWYSDSFFSMFGYKNAEPQQSRKLWSANIHPDDKERVQSTIHRLLNTNTSHFSLEYRFQKSDGGYAEVLDRSYILHDEYGTPYRMLKSMLDITELRKARQEVKWNIEQRQFLAESVPLIVWTANPDGKITFINKNFELFTGESTTEATDYSWKRFVDPTDLLKLKKIWLSALRSTHDFEVEIKIRNASHEYKWHLLRARAQLTNRVIYSWVGSATDIDQQKRISEVMEQKVLERTIELKKLNVALRSSNNDLQQFASVASHDLKEPIRKIHLYGNLLKNKYLQEMDGATIFADKIIQSASRMTKLVNDLLSYSKVSDGSFFEMLNLNTIITEILDDLEIVIREKDATFSISHFPMIEAIPGLIRQLFQNLISNALKFSKPDVVPSITIHSTVISEKKFSSSPQKDGGFVRIVVKDNGIGFDEVYKDKIFTLFQRLHGTDEYEGTGIGLALCKKIIEKHNGLIDAHSKLGEGAEFVIILPVKQN
ncbi:chemotaxis protein CheB [Xanthocytophaga flava]|uniref:chemotaxis protein CheB n=1 Tax=Xanthocytophaga flava TaxID=3048013 RepID=UPI0028D58797|nr:chemotaxis protein CheB [Xanthocytophaga flavus]MDJ1472655.1 chemotaxis protein CheB [Xanthocytophaga flavus]